MSFNKIPEDKRKRSYSDRLVSTPKEEQILLLIADALGHFRRQDYVAAYGGTGWKGSKLTVKDRVNLLKKDVGDVYAKTIISDNDSQYSLACRTLKSNRREWHRDVEAGEKKNASHSAKRRAEGAQRNLDIRTEPTVCFGGRQLWKEAQTDSEKMTEFKLRRMWLGAVGRGDYVPSDEERVRQYYSNQMIRVSDDKSVMVVVPFCLRKKLGISGRNIWMKVGEVCFHHGQEILDDAKENGVSITFHIQRTDGHWKVRAQTSLPEIEKLPSKRILGVDVNAGHLDAWVVDEFGNPVGSPITIAVKKRGIENSVNKLLAWASSRGVTAVALEDVKNIQRSRTRGGKRGALNKAISQIQSGKLKSLMTTACEDRGWALEIIDPAYTSKNADSWADIAHRGKDRHQKASYLIGRRGLGLTIYRESTQTRKIHSGGSESLDLDVELSETEWPLTFTQKKKTDQKLIF